LVIPKEKLIDMYKTMLRIRRFEEKIVELVEVKGKAIQTHLYIGEEAVASGVCAALRKDDYITSTHRGHGHAIAKGISTKYMMAELLQKRTGTNKGKGGSMHIAQIEVGNLGMGGIVGAGIPIATGAGLSAKLRKTDQVAVCFFGDGAANIGTFHEGLNMAGKWKLPVVFVCENNLYAGLTAHSDACSVENVSVRAISYGMPSVTVDGMDVVAVYETANEAVKRAREGRGPTLIECKTYRYYGHGGTRDEEMYVVPIFHPGVRYSTYRSREEIKEWKKRDPIKTFSERLIMQNVLSGEELEKIDGEIRREMEEAVKFAEDSPEPAPEEALEGLFYE